MQGKKIIVINVSVKLLKMLRVRIYSLSLVMSALLTTVENPIRLGSLEHYRYYRVLDISL